MSMMNVQCSVCESQLLHPIESVIAGSALMGNAVEIAPTYRLSKSARMVYGLDNFTGFILIFSSPSSFSGYLGVPYSTPFDYYMACGRSYQTRTDTIANATGSAWVGSQSWSGDIPHSTGYPSGYNYTYTGGYIDPQATPTGSASPFGVDPAVPSAYTSGGWQADSTYGFSPTSTLKSWAHAIGTDHYEDIHSVLSDVSDFSSQFSSAKSDILGVSWTWASGNCFSGTYNQPISFPSDITGVDFSGYDFSFSTTTSASSYGPVFGYGCVNGWSVGIPYGQMTFYRGLAKNTTGYQQAYYIGRYRETIGLENSPLVNSGVTVTVKQIDLISCGIILPDQVIGIGADIDLPFPDSHGFPETEFGRSVLSTDFYFAVIGSNPPSDYFKTYTSVTT